MKDLVPGSPQEQDPLDALLREADEYIADGGFTARVVRALPARRRRPVWRIAVLATALLICAGLAAWALPPAGAILNLARFGVGNLQVNFLLALVPVLAAVGCLVWGALSLANEED